MAHNLRHYNGYPPLHPPPHRAVRPPHYYRHPQYEEDHNFFLLEHGYSPPSPGHFHRGRDGERIMGHPLYHPVREYGYLDHDQHYFERPSRRERQRRPTRSPTRSSRKRYSNEIDRYEHFDEDGEALNEQEVLAARNAVLNKKSSVATFETYKSDDQRSKQTDESEQLRSIIASMSLNVNKPLPPDVNARNPSLTAETSPNTETASVVTKEMKPTEVQTLPVIVEPPPPLVTIEPSQQTRGVDTINGASTAQPPKKNEKKKWKFDLFSLFCKSDTFKLVPPPRVIRTVTPPTPMLSSGMSSTSSSPFTNPEHGGYWAYKRKNSAIWVTFDPDNQLRISAHVARTGLAALIDSEEAMLQLPGDASIMNGSMPVLVVPTARLCFVPINHAHSEQFDELQLQYFQA